MIVSAVAKAATLSPSAVVRALALIKLSTQPEQQLFTAFSGDGLSTLPGPAAGNPCGVSLLVQAPDMSFVPEPGMFCVSWQTADDEAEVRCWSPTGQPITLCGHGLLCCGQAWRNADLPISRLVMSEIPVAFHARADRAWLGLPSIASAPCPMPSWVQTFFPTPPWRAAQAGGDSDYLILEWPADFDLSSLEAPGYSLHRRTQRSIIATCLDTADSPIDIQLRYFAPQHGVPEDAATGSAMRVLATYWLNRELDQSLHAYQCSPRGGELFSRVREGLTWVGGRVVATPQDVLRGY